MFEFANWSARGKAFILEMRIKELKNAIERWPNSQKLEARKAELAEAEEELRELQVGYQA